MLVRTINYEDLDGNKASIEAHFHMSKAELIEIEVSYEGNLGLEGTINRIIAENDRKALIAEFKRLILMSYGVREGARFVKNDKLREQFEQHPAYSALFMELATDGDAAGKFVAGIVPKDLSDAVETQVRTALPPPPPPAA